MTRSISDTGGSAARSKTRPWAGTFLTAITVTITHQSRTGFILHESETCHAAVTSYFALILYISYSVEEKERKKERKQTLQKMRQLNILTPLFIYSLICTCEMFQNVHTTIKSWNEQF